MGLAQGAFAYVLRPAIQQELQTVLTWIKTPEQLKLWGGPALSFPPETARTWHEIEARDGNSFALVDADGQLVGFGQTLSRAANVIHLGRIIVSPHCRGKGLGRLLCEQLINVANEQSRPDYITLNVYKNNGAAFSLYTAIGFEVMAEDRENNSCFMRLSSARERDEVAHRLML